jgi:hypothetical protein
MRMCMCVVRWDLHTNCAIICDPHTHVMSVHTHALCQKRCDQPWRIHLFCSIIQTYIHTYMQYYMAKIRLGSLCGSDSFSQNVNLRCGNSFLLIFERCIYWILALVLRLCMHVYIKCFMCTGIHSSMRFGKRHVYACMQMYCMYVLCWRPKPEYGQLLWKTSEYVFMYACFAACMFCAEDQTQNMNKSFFFCRIPTHVWSLLNEQQGTSGDVCVCVCVSVCVCVHIHILTDCAMFPVSAVCAPTYACMHVCVYTNAYWLTVPCFMTLQSNIPSFRGAWTHRCWWDILLDAFFFAHCVHVFLHAIFFSCTFFGPFEFWDWCTYVCVVENLRCPWTWKFSLSNFVPDSRMMCYLQSENCASPTSSGITLCWAKGQREGFVRKTALSLSEGQRDSGRLRAQPRMWTQGNCFCINYFSACTPLWLFFARIYPHEAVDVEPSIHVRNFLSQVVHS